MTLLFNFLTLELIASSPCPVDHLCQFASTSVYLFIKYRIHKTSVVADGQFDNITTMSMSGRVVRRLFAAGLYFQRVQSCNLTCENKSNIVNYSSTRYMS